MSFFQSLWSYRGFIIGSVRREFQLKYRNSLLGAFWNILNPLAMIVIYTVIFSKVMKTRLPDVDHGFGYSIFLCSGILTWGLFSEICGRGLTIFIDHANLIKKIQFPRLSLPVIVLLSALLNFAISFALFLVFLVLVQVWPGWVVLSALPVLAVQLCFAAGLGMSLGVLNVFFRDVGQLFGIVLQFWFWLTPIVYPPGILPEWVRAWMALNPMAPLIEAYQGIFVQGHAPIWTSLLYPLSVSLVLCLWAFFLFRRHAGDMVDEL
jgi:lipopolysaccharide transport system permease protein